MNIIKSIVAIVLVSMIAFSCKSEKKDADAAEEVAVEEVSETPAESSDPGVEATETEEVAETEGATEEVAEQAETKKITVVYPKDTELANEVEKAIGGSWNKVRQIRKQAAASDKAFAVK